MRDLDNRAQSIMKDIDGQAEEHLKVVAQTSPEKRKEQMDKIQKLFNKAKEYGDDKVQLAIQTYELVSCLFTHTVFHFQHQLIIMHFIFKVDKHIRRLDSDLARFETEIKDKASTTTLSAAEEDSPSAAKSKTNYSLSVQ